MAIVNLLTERADRGATISEIAAVLGQTPGTLVPVLASLSAGGFVVRQPRDRRYRLGPALITPGQVAAGRFPALAPTRRVMEELAQRTGYAVFAFQRDGEHARLVETVWDLTRPAPWMRIGEVVPIEAPLGSVFVAWAGPIETARWIGAENRPASTVDALEARLALARALGFVVELRPPSLLVPELSRLVRRGQQMRRAERIPRSITGVEGFLAERVDRRSTYEVSTVSVPVGATTGEVTLTLNLVGFDEPVGGSELRRLGALGVAAAADLAERLGIR